MTGTARPRRVKLRSDHIYTTSYLICCVSGFIIAYQGIDSTGCLIEATVVHQSLFACRPHKVYIPYAELQVTLVVSVQKR